ncbi:hypothetical protein BGZ96_007872, partial [Linnemannia gamsii]
QIEDLVYPSTLPRLGIRLGSESSEEFRLSIILDQCLLLEELFVFQPHGLKLDGPWVSTENNNSPMGWIFITQGILRIWIQALCTGGQTICLIQTTDQVFGHVET